MRHTTNTTSKFFDEAAVRSASTTSSTQSEAIEKLGQVAHADNFRRFREACARYAVDVPGRARSATNPSHVPKRHRAFGDEHAVEAALRGARNGTHALALLGLSNNGHNYNLVMAEAERLGISMVLSIHTSVGRSGILPPKQQSERQKVKSMAPGDLAAMVGLAGDQTSLLKTLGLGHRTSDYVWLSEHLPDSGFDSLPKHPRPSDDGWSKQGGRPEIPNREFFAINTKRNTGSLKKRIFRDDLIPHEQCVMCSGARVWNGRVIELHLDHINGDHIDNRLENLRFLCPNCHSQTDTYCKPKHLRLPVL